MERSVIWVAADMDAALVVLHLLLCFESLLAVLDLALEFILFADSQVMHVD